MVHEARLEHRAEYAVEKAEQVVMPLKASRFRLHPGIDAYEEYDALMAEAADVHAESYIPPVEYGGRLYIAAAWLHAAAMELVAPPEVVVEEEPVDETTEEAPVEAEGAEGDDEPAEGMSASIMSTPSIWLISGPKVASMIGLIAVMNAW
jgi:hypothetical protein